MTLFELDAYFNSFLKKENFPNDISRNGIQIQNEAPDRKPISKVAFAVDACEATALEAVSLGADVLFVHHGLFWGDCTVLTGSQYKRIAAFIKNDIALCAYHIPLDAHEKLGNNAGLADRIGLKKKEPFGEWKNMTIGVKGVLRSLLSADELASLVMRPEKKSRRISVRTSKNPYGRNYFRRGGRRRAAGCGRTLGCVYYGSFRARRLSLCKRGGYQRHRGRPLRNRNRRRKPCACEA